MMQRTAPFASNDDSTAPGAAPIVGRSINQLTGETVSGYRLGRVLGKGAVGVVYEAEQLSLERTVAFKVMRTRSVTENDEEVQAMLDEARIAGSIQHPGIANVHECGQDGDFIWYSMELVAGDNLQQLMKREGRINPGNGTLTLRPCWPSPEGST